MSRAWKVQKINRRALTHSGRGGRRVPHICLLDGRGKVWASVQITKYTDVEAETARLQGVADKQNQEAMSTDKRDDVLRAIARDALGFETLELRNSDSLDFKEVHVSALRNALFAAFEAGRLARQ